MTAPARTGDAAWAAAREAADVVVMLPTLAGGEAPVELFLRRVPATGPRGFRMGARGEYADEEPIHRVVIDHDFYLGTFVVTQEQWAAVWPDIDAVRWYAKDSGWGAPPGAAPSHRNDGAASRRHPVERVSWYDAFAFCDCLSRHKDFVDSDLHRQGFRFALPTEAEWEYACRGGGQGLGSDTEYWNGNGEAALREVGWFGGNSGSWTHAVDEPVIAGSQERHPLGLFGMHGNVWEWCHDEWDAGRYRDHVDGDSDKEAVRHRWRILGDVFADGPEAFSQHKVKRLRVIRGGAWSFTARRCRSAYPGRLGPGGRDLDLGLRVCLVRDPSSASSGGAAARVN